MSIDRFWLLGLGAPRRVPLIYGQPYGKLPYSRFPDSIFFPFLEIFLSFSEKNKFRHFFMSQNNFSSEILVGRKNFKKQVDEIKKNLQEKF